ncbi:hypothetical protein DNTS_009825 [Danionella cerebrum]|uniref:Laminin G domain-containing protein n=1 Tax=Danionella cerebrum TaxID=2873325 RepID=A0A553MXN0_9TELE|nr:hypothetical protein DNTS_009825 [Danionella translucida]
MHHLFISLILSLCLPLSTFLSSGQDEWVATFKGSEFFCFDLSLSPIQSSTDEITLSFRTLQRNGLMLHTGKSADYVNLSLKSGAVWLVINLGSGAFEALVEPVNGKFNDNNWHSVKVTRNLRQHSGIGHAMVNKLHYMVDIFLIVFYFGLDLDSFCASKRPHKLPLVSRIHERTVQQLFIQTIS